MNNKLSAIHKYHSEFCMLGFLILCLTYPIQGMTGELDTYRYQLEANNNDKVCSHMADVFSKYFKKPFNTTNDEDEYVKAGGVLPPLLPGAKDDLRSFINMRFSFQPTSPEFDAIKWRVGKIKRPNHGEAGGGANVPFIAADLDINNDGKLETVIKSSFMSCYIPGCYAGHSDDLSIFRKDDIDLMKGPLEVQEIVNGQNGHHPLAFIYGRSSSCDLVRPFIYNGITYLSCYHRKWLKDFSDPRNLTPAREYTDVLKYQGVEKLPDGREPIKAETVCRFRMTVAKKSGE